MISSQPENRNPPSRSPPPLMNGGEEARPSLDLAAGATRGERVPLIRETADLNLMRVGEGFIISHCRPIHVPINPTQTPV